MFITRKQYNALETGIDNLKSNRKINNSPNKHIVPPGDSVYYAAVDLLNATNSAVTAVNNVYKYDAVLYYKQFSPHSDPNEYVKDVDLAQYQASESVILLSAWDLKSLVDEESATQIAVVPCIQRNNYFECVSPDLEEFMKRINSMGDQIEEIINGGGGGGGGASPDNLVNSDNFGRSVDLRTALVNGILTAALELYGFFDGLYEGATLDEVLSANPNTGDISGNGASKYRLVVRVETPGTRPRLGYMRIHTSPNDAEDGEVDDGTDCGVGGFPGTLPIDNDSGGFPGEEEGTDTNSENKFPGESSGDITRDDDFPGKIDKCW